MSDRQLDHDSHRSSGIRYPVCLLADDVESPLNVGSLFRIADALGVSHVYLTGKSARPPNPRIRTTSRTAERSVPHTYVAHGVDAVAGLRADGFRIVCVEITDQSVALDAFEVQAGDKLCLVFGAENAGVSQALLDLSDATVHIPMLGTNSSMNVANAAAIATYEIVRKLQVAGR